jgi:hypothetical protein
MTVPLGTGLDHHVEGHDVLARPQVGEARLRARLGGVVGLVRLIVGEDPGRVDAVLVLEPILGGQVPGALDDERVLVLGVPAVGSSGQSIATMGGTG